MRFKKLDLVNYFPLTENLNLVEFQCPCCHQVRVVPRLVWVLQRLREDLGCELYIESGFRCEKHNKEEGGHKLSYHLVGMAADLKAKEGGPERLFLRATSDPNVGGCGIYTYGIVHIDIRTAKRSFWVCWTAIVKDKLEKHYRYFSTPEAVLECYREKMASIQGSN